MTTFSEMEHRYDNPVASFRCARVNKSMHEQKVHIHMLSCSEEPKTQQITVTDMREKPVDFFNDIAQASTLAPVKVSVPVESVIPCVMLVPE